VFYGKCANNEGPKYLLLAIGSLCQVLGLEIQKVVFAVNIMVDPILSMLVLNWLETPLHRIA
jgi:hypothetical protein